jgi:TonB family protein
MPKNFGWLSSSFRGLFLLLALSAYILTASGQEARKRLASPQPSYPELARRMGLSGVVKIELVIGADGEITESKVIGGHPLLADAALKALRDWKYEKAKSETKIEVEFKFHS